ncbi:transcriptional regulator [Sphingomonas sanxanigenens]|uniref:Uncharacterized protein n=1 Tax=Sphingomonas sanxanigenens DSM 19645 = NX02 TaxID=1123269 RepID=W0A6Z7_9SPHN|nr:transcriptional regulator [Sphingomonas sanxanigenens]AHE52093.1 hypothetical protein NX02_01655 [Sphingomonas sanxanigenens DSM 19645 = NX02]
MHAFLDFEASSLGKQGVPIEVAWVFEDGRAESHLIRPAPGWTDWSAEAEAIHRIARETLVREGAPHDVVAQRMIECLEGHDLFASAPSWDGKWLSALLRAAGLPRHTLRLRATEAARRETVAGIIAPHVGAASLDDLVEDILTLLDVRARDDDPAHRALPDARVEQLHWLAARDAALAFVAGGGGSSSSDQPAGR